MILNHLLSCHQVLLQLLLNLHRHFSLLPLAFLNSTVVQHVVLQRFKFVHLMELSPTLQNLFTLLSFVIYLVISILTWLWKTLHSSQHSAIVFIESVVRFIFLLTSRLTKKRRSGSLRPSLALSRWLMRNMVRFNCAFAVSARIFKKSVIFASIGLIARCTGLKRFSKLLLVLHVVGDQEFLGFLTTFLAIVSHPQTWVVLST